MGFFLFSGANLAFPLSAAPSFTVTLTAYNAVPAQTDSDPFTTASGMYSNPDLVAARSPLHSRKQGVELPSHAGEDGARVR